MSLQNLIQELKRENLCTYFVLPLLKLNKFSFAGSNFINSYIAKTGTHIVVQVYDPSIVDSIVIRHPEFIESCIKDGFPYYIFSIPQKFNLDVCYFTLGMFSRMSEKAKDHIREWSGLDYKKQMSDTKVVTDMRLLALTKDRTLYEMWERELEITLGPSDELLTKPDERSFIDLCIFDEKWAQ